VELLLKEAESLAACFERDGLKRHQLRAFYDHAKRQLQRLQYGASFADVHPEIAKLKAFAADRAQRAENKLPVSFKQFIDRNINAITDRKSFERGFMPHFEAVVAYCARIRE
jgi:CRISPR type III-A-associated protein Csm2